MSDDRKHVFELIQDAGETWFPLGLFDSVDAARDAVEAHCLRYAVPPHDYRVGWSNTIRLEIRQRVFGQVVDEDCGKLAGVMVFQHVIDEYDNEFWKPRFGRSVTATGQGA